MKRLFFASFVIIFAIAIAITCVSCTTSRQRGDYVTKTYSVSDVHTVCVENLSLKKDGSTFGATVEFVCDGGEPSISLSMQESMFDTVKLNQYGQSVVVSGKKGCVYITDYDVKITVKNCVLTEIDLSYGCVATADAASLGDNLSIDLSGGSRLTAKTATCGAFELEASGGSRAVFDSISCSNMTVDLSGGSTFASSSVTSTSLRVEASGGSRTTFDVGSSESVSLEFSGASTFAGPRFNGETVSVDLSGGSRVNVSCSGRITGNASGGSTVEYQGAATVNVDTSGGSSVNRV
ncbi:MAG: DUF2807 domain-containing protein [Clostridia bacterium]|nr:DUF2807 domain-containing protein [Clostridia bacterium]